MRALSRGDILSMICADYPYILVHADPRHVGTDLRTAIAECAPLRQEIDTDLVEPLDEAAIVERIKKGESFFTVSYNGWTPQTMDLMDRCLRVELP